LPLKLINKYAIPIFLLFLAGVFFAPGIAALLFGLLCALLAMEMRSTLRSLRKSGAEAIAKIERFERDSDGDPIPVMSFETADGTRVEGRLFYHFSSAFVFQSGSRAEVGKEQVVLFVPDNPTAFVKQKDAGQARVVYRMLLVLMMLVAAAGIADLMGCMDIETSKPVF
jgi:hypothetical protein